MNFFAQQLLSIVVASAAGIALLLKVFKRSVFFKVGLIWLFSLLFVMFTTAVKYKFFDTEDGALARLLLMVVNVTVCMVSFYLASISVVRPISDAIDKTNEIAEGNLNVQIEESGKNANNDLGRLIQATRTIRDNLQKIIGRLNGEVASLNTSGQQLDDMARQLSNGASEQAASVEEISSSMEEMAANIQQNAEFSLQAKQIAASAVESIARVGRSSSDSLESVRDIAQRINIINDIAFQTNILALNAAVEAARAGEYGRGFAVVAAEVRKLAEHSKQAADQIVKLAEQSVGVSEKSTAMLLELIPQIEKSAQIVQEIHASSAEQSMGAMQINNAIQQLNQVTQQSADASSDMSSRADDLNQKARHIGSLISYFKL